MLIELIARAIAVNKSGPRTYLGKAPRAPYPQPRRQQPQACTKAIDCKGRLPQICMICSDGVIRCAHWTFGSAMCAIEMCPGGK
jgi:hypothetical protein